MLEKQKIKFVIESRLENVSLVGISIRRLCSSILSLDEKESSLMELAVVEAANNAIVHAYDKKAGFEVEIILSIQQDKIIFFICDTGKAMDTFPPIQEEVDLEDVENIPESGRGISIIFEIMDEVVYKSANGKNFLILTKLIKSEK